MKIKHFRWKDICYFIGVALIFISLLAFVAYVINWSFKNSSRAVSDIAQCSREAPGEARTPNADDIVVKPDKRQQKQGCPKCGGKSYKIHPFIPGYYKCDTCELNFNRLSVGESKQLEWLKSVNKDNIDKLIDGR